MEPSLASLRKPHDGLISRWINRPLSLAMTRRLANTRVMPNQISIFTMLLGLSSGLLVMQGGYWTGLGGAFLLQAQSILDGVDGELARLRSQTSRLGQWLDTVSDDLGLLSFLVGTLFTLRGSPVGAFGVLGVASFLLTQAIVYHRLATVYHSGDLFDFPWNHGSAGGLVSRFNFIRFLFRHDFLCLLSLILALFGRLDWFLLFASLGKIARLISLFTLQRRFPR